MSASQSSKREAARLLKRAGKTYAEVGEVMGISRQRAQQLVSPTSQERSELFADITVCEDCGKESETLDAHHDNYDSAPSRLLCKSCHRKADAKLGFVKKCRNGSKIVRQLPLNLMAEDETNLHIIRHINPLLKTDADVIRDALAFRVAMSKPIDVKRARRLLEASQQVEATA